MSHHLANLTATSRIYSVSWNYLIICEFPRGVGYGMLAELMRRGLAGMGISERFQSKAGWRITALGLECTGLGAARINTHRAIVAADFHLPALHALQFRWYLRGHASNWKTSLSRTHPCRTE
jgi:hypothetical protein